MVTPTLKSNTGDQTVCKEKNLSWLFGADRKVRPSGSLFRMTQQSLRFFYPNLTPMKDSYIVVCVFLFIFYPPHGE